MLRLVCTCDRDVLRLSPRYGPFAHHGEDWGGPGGSITVGIVGNVPAIPLPRPDVVTPNRVVDNSKGLFKSEPKPVPKPPPDAMPIPEIRDETSRRRLFTRPSKVLENPDRRRRTNAIPYGGGGTPTIPVTSFAMGAGTTQAGLSLQRSGRRRFRLALLVVRGGGAAAHQQQLAAVDRRPERGLRAARGRDVHDFARRHGHEHSGHAKRATTTRWIARRCARFSHPVRSTACRAHIRARR